METKLVVVDILSPCNAIVGRDWVQRMKGITCTLYQVIKFATPRGEEKFYSDQVAAKQCYLATMNTKTTMKEVKFVKEEREELEDVGRIPEDKLLKT